ncbi:hypothetical protein BDB00DRAFT_769137 [Zychaea mexicana]|uniref:uncharacterized protein n=1 Tax=Zychaea mexicana TaxID=64656 RepID=UPI0022FE42A6|nr:uncharacterized protein BDB00DRAFT_769137 [Zychaea mexicana]KAI9490306.1 hypothetical protein BDB00DRAFT_769137 [Zychaea mexicana]
MAAPVHSQELHSFLLPHKHRPGTDLMSKHVLLDPTVMGIVIDTVVSPEAKKQYSPWPTEWVDGNRSDVLYIPNTHNDELHPIIVEVQHTVNNDFILRLMSYAISAYREHNKRPLIVITFAVSSIKYEVTKKTIRNKRHPFLLQYPSQPWAHRCYLIDNHSI